MQAKAMHSSVVCPDNSDINPELLYAACTPWNSGKSIEEQGMYIINGIAYEDKELRQVESVKALDGMKLVVRFKGGEKKLFNASCLLEDPVFQPLRDAEVFWNVKVEFGTLSWNNGDIDIDTDTIYEKSRPW